jgi:outer membrane protein OmpA-like peptidoglycan-associated protein/opacity protein-like surface antigen
MHTEKLKGNMLAVQFITQQTCAALTGRVFTWIAAVIFSKFRDGGFAMRKLIILAALVVLVSGAAMAQDYPKVELFGGYSFLRISPGEGLKGGNLPGGWHASIAGNVNDWFGLAADFSGHYGSPDYGLGFGGIKTRAYPFTFGPRFSYRKNERFTPFAHAQFGGAHVNALGGGVSQNAFAMNFGGGVDAKINDRFAFRIGQFDYLPTRFDGPVSGNKAWQHNFRFSTGIVFRFGGNPPPPPPPANRAPVATCSVDKSMIYVGSADIAVVRAQASDADNDTLTYTWTTTGGAVDGSGPDVRWNSSGATPGTYAVKVRVSDSKGGTADCSVDIRVEPPPNRAPSLTCSAERSTVRSGERVRISAVGSDPDGDTLTYSWRTSNGQIIGSGQSVQLDTSGLAAGTYTVTGRAEDGRGGAADCSASVSVEVPPPPPQASKINECFFRASSARVDNVCKRILDDVAIRLQNDARAKVVIVGYADAAEPRHDRLAGQRNDAVKKYLTEKGIADTRVDVRAASGQAGADKQNRRVDVIWVPEGATY